ncbi:MAG: class I SAM-dependent methyltransferase, partial [Gemmatimonadaceae bacterium]
MFRVDYDGIAPAFDRRYQINRYDGTRRALLEFVGTNASCDVCEVGCGTGHWLAELRDRARTIVGIDPSSRMLDEALQSGTNALVVRACAESFPFPSARFDRVYAINAFHHFVDTTAFATEARRVLRPGGAVMTIGLDPHTGADQWWVWDFFPTSLVADKERYAPTAAIRALLERAGFVNAATSVAEHFPVERGFSVA